jgi:hypothetical protein
MDLRGEEQWINVQGPSERLDNSFAKILNDDNSALTPTDFCVQKSFELPEIEISSTGFLILCEEPEANNSAVLLCDII